MIYMKILRISSGFIWYFNKDTGADVYHRVNYEETLIADALAKGKMMLQYFKTGELPEYRCDPDKCKIKHLCQM
jgi:hypothetical protein